MGQRPLKEDFAAPECSCTRNLPLPPDGSCYILPTTVLQSDLAATPADPGAGGETEHREQEKTVADVK